MRLLPFFHWGAPPNEINVEVRQTRVRMRERGKLKPKRLIRRLRVRRWFGLSHPWEPKWFIGVIRWDQIKEGPASVRSIGANGEDDSP